MCGVLEPPPAPQGLGTQIQSRFKSEEQDLMLMKEEMQVGNKDKLESRVQHRAI